jgi:hypothetical protein
VIRFQRETSFLSERHDEIAVQPRPDYPDSGIRVEHPRDLFKETITLTPEHGPLAELLCNGKPSLDLTGQEFWDLLCLWVTLSSQDCERALDAIL